VGRFDMRRVITDKDFNSGRSVEKHNFRYRSLGFDYFGNPLDSSPYQEVKILELFPGSMIIPHHHKKRDPPCCPIDKGYTFLHPDALCVDFKGDKVYLGTPEAEMQEQLVFSPDNKSQGVFFYWDKKGEMDYAILNDAGCVIRVDISDMPHTVACLPWSDRPLTYITKTCAVASAVPNSVAMQAQVIEVAKTMAIGKSNFRPDMEFENPIPAETFYAANRPICSISAIKER
jgi:hypothetical protein